MELLDEFKLKLVVDIRTIPKSRHNPQFGGTHLAKSLKKHGIEYEHRPGLGGLRRPRKDSINTEWRNSAFRGFADYMQTDEFQKNLQRLITRSKRKRLAIMCAEAVPWRCHRSLIADALYARGIPVEEIMAKKSHRLHKLTSFAEIADGVTYPKRASKLS